ncbi:MAG: hypothetical protein HYU73_25555, partial [Betaproteobacteria bacterium]|nr:hypothetical protein [Betaproteobacteria bacterium]
MVERARRQDAARAEGFVPRKKVIEARVPQLHVVQAGLAALVVGLAFDRRNLEYAEYLGVRVGHVEANEGDIPGAAPGSLLGVRAHEKSAHARDGFPPL